MSAPAALIKLDAAEYLTNVHGGLLGLEPGEWGEFRFHVPGNDKSHFTCLTNDLAWFNLFLNTPRDVLENMDFPWQQKCQRLYKGWVGDDYFGPM